MAIIKSGASSDLLTIDATSKAARVTLNDSQGRELSLGGKITYAAATGVFTPPATPTDMSCLWGSATKTIRVLACYISGLQTATGINLFNLIKRSSANSGGTWNAATAVPLDANDAAATAIAGWYTVNPTSLGTVVGNIRSTRVCCPIATGLLVPPLDLIQFAQNDELSKLPTLRGVAQGLAVNFGGAALPGGLTMAVEWVWLEE
jgi:hypothetical protein